MHRRLCACFHSVGSHADSSNNLSQYLSNACARRRPSSGRQKCVRRADVQGVHALVTEGFVAERGIFSAPASFLAMNLTDEWIHCPFVCVVSTGEDLCISFGCIDE